MKQMKIDKRIADELAGIRKLAGILPPGKGRALLNKCDKISVLSRKAQAMVDAPVGRLFPAPRANYDARTQDDMAAQAKCKQAVFEAMLAGRRVDLRNASEFRVSQMHTAIAQIRRDINRKHPDLLLCDEWVRPEGTRPFKRYWIVKQNS